MTSYPTSYNDGGNDMHSLGANSNNLPNHNAKNSSLARSLENISARNLNLNTIVKNELTSEKYLNIANSAAYDVNNRRPVALQEYGFYDSTLTSLEKGSMYEYIEYAPNELIEQMNNYKFMYKNRTKSLVDNEKSGQSVKVLISNVASVPSMFNPMYNVQAIGFTRNVPLLNDDPSWKTKSQYEDTSDCSIHRLVKLSHQKWSLLGNARYKFADFMYCKDLGKVSNNRLITLRKFAHPVGDHIFEHSVDAKGSNAYGLEAEGDVGRLVAWFDTEDNKLEEILKYEYKASWKQLNSKSDDSVTSRADDKVRGPLGLIANAVNPAYNKMAAQGHAGNHSLWSLIGSKLSQGVLQGIGDNSGVLRNYDNNKVYTPANTVQDTHIYEGKLTFSHEITLVFSYKLRAYQNINPKSAMLDLLGNILEVTYRRGHFWGGERKIIGPPQNTSVYDKVDRFIDGTWDKLGGIMGALQAGTIDFGSILACISSSISESFNAAMNIGKQYLNDLQARSGSGLGAKLAGAMNDLNSAVGLSDAIKGQLKNYLGRPALYAMDSLLKGDDVGLWHLTIGNPLNPIVSMGNLILDNAQIQHSGPLGIDDFPSEIKVTVTLKPARSRDLTEISRMYTKGISALYVPTARNKMKDFWSVNESVDETTVEPVVTEEEQEEYTENNKTEASKNQSSSSAEEKKKEQPTYDPSLNRTTEINGIAEKSTYNYHSLNDETLKFPLINTYDAYQLHYTNQSTWQTFRKVLDETA